MFCQIWYLTCECTCVLWKDQKQRKPYLIKFFYVSNGGKRGKTNIKYWQFGNETGLPVIKGVGNYVLSYVSKHTLSWINTFKKCL